MADKDKVEIQLFSPGFEEFFVRYAQQIAHAEVFVETDESLPINSPVTLVFMVVYEDLEVIRAEGIVSYVTNASGKTDTATPPAGAHPPASLAGMGVKLTSMDEPFRAYILELMKRQIRADLSRMFTT